MLRAVSLSPTGFVNVLSFGADNTGTSDCESAFDAAVATGKDVYVPAGTYKISAAGGGITLADYQRIFGDGFQSRINYSGFGACINIGSYSQVDGLRLVGSGKAKGGFWLTQRGVSALSQKVGWVIKNMLITDIAGDDTSTGGGAIYCIGQQQAPIDFALGGQLSNVIAYNNNCGFNFANRGEYVSASNCTAHSNSVGVSNWGGNTAFTSGNISQNTTGLKIGAQTNDGHGTYTATRINHNTDNLVVSGITNGMEFSACFFYGGNITLTDCNGIEFIGCHLSGSGAASGTPGLTLSGTCTNTQIIGGRFPTGATTGALVQTLNGNTLTLLNTLNY